MATIKLSCGVSWRGSNYASVYYTSDLPILKLQFGAGQYISWNLANGGFTDTLGTLTATHLGHSIRYFNNSVGVMWLEDTPETNAAFPIDDPFLGHTFAGLTDGCTELTRDGWDWHRFMILMQSSSLDDAGDGWAEFYVDGVSVFRFDGEITNHADLDGRYLARLESRCNGDLDSAWVRVGNTVPISFSDEGFPTGTLFTAARMEGSLDTGWSTAGDTPFFFSTGGVNDTGFASIHAGEPDAFACGDDVFESRGTAGVASGFRYVDLTVDPPEDPPEPPVDPPPPPPEETAPPPTRKPPVLPPPTSCPCPPTAPTSPPTSGTPPLPPGTPPPTPPTPGEPPPAWTPGSLCPGGGTVDSYDVAEPGESMVGVREDRVWAEVAFVSIEEDTETPTPEYWALNQTIPDPHDVFGGRKHGRVMSVSSIKRSVSDDNGNLIGARVSVQLNDKDRAALRSRLGRTADKYVWTKQGVIRCASEANRRSGYATEPRELFRGVCDEVALEAGFTGRLTFEDKLLSQFGKFGPDRSFSSRLLTRGMLPGLPDETIGKPQQWIFGEVSDKGRIDPATGLPAQKGRVPLTLVGSLGTEDEYHMAAHDIGEMELYGSDGSEWLVRVLIDPSEYRIETMDLTDADTGLTHRVTHVFLPIGSPATEAHKSGRLTMTANACGVKGLNGETITDLFSIYQYIFEHIVLPEQESLTGEYIGSPLWADGRAMIHSDSFAALQAMSIERVGGLGYQGRFILGGPANGAVKLRELLRRMSNSAGCGFVWTAAGQLKAVAVDDTAEVDDSPIIRDQGMRVLPTPRFERGEVENPVLFSYDWDDDAQRPGVAQESVQDDIAMGKMGGPKPSPTPVEMRLTGHPETARDVASRRNLLRRYPPAYYPVVEPIDGLDKDPGDVVRIISIEGAGEGSDLRPLFLRETTYDPGTRRNTHDGRDIFDVLASGSSWADDAGPEDWDSATEDERELYTFWTDDDDTVPSDGADGKEWR